MDQVFAGEIAARLDQRPFSRTIWHFVFLIAVGGVFELYDLFMTAYIAPGLVKSGLFANTTVGLFGITGVGFFVFCTFIGMFVGTIGFGFVADRVGRRSIFTVSLVWYSIATAIMAFQTDAVGVDLWRFIASVGIGLEQVTIDTFLPEMAPPHGRGKAFAFYQFIEFLIVPIVALLGWLLVPLQPLGFDGWRWVAIIASVGAMGAWYLRFALPESPRWLALHGQRERALAIVADMEARCMRDIVGPLRAPAAALPAIPGKSRFVEILKPPYGKRTLIMSIFNLLSTIGYYGFGAWVPTLLIAKGIQITTSLEYAFIIAVANPVGRLSGINFVGSRVIEHPDTMSNWNPNYRFPSDLAGHIETAITFLEACFHRQPSEAEFRTALAYNMLVPLPVRNAITGWSTGIDETVAALNRVTVPVLVSQGRQDRGVRPVAAEMLAAAVSTARLCWYDECGHSPFVEARERFNRELAEFVTECWTA